jgi:deoxyribose-phosphate aldolase
MNHDATLILFVFMKYTYCELAGMIDHALLHPTMTDAELRAGCELAARYGVASVCIKPYAVKGAVELLKGSGVAVGTVVGFPHGSNATEVKRYETELACRDGATEIDVVINVGKALSGDFDFVERDIREVVEETHRHGALVKVILETDFLPDDEIKIRLCEICGRANADFVKTSTGFGFVKQADGEYNYKGATAHDLALMRAHTLPSVQLKASGGIRTLDDLILARDLGATRCGTSATAALLDEYRRREAEAITEIQGETKDLGGGGY